MAEWLRRAIARKGAIWYVYKVGWLAVGVFGVMALYFFSSDITLGRQTHLMTTLDAAIPFLPWTWWIYFPGYLAGLVFTVLIVRDDDILARAVLAILLAQVLCTIIYMFFPSSFPRPVDWQGSGLTADAIRWFWELDPPNNTFPSSHVMLSTQASLALWRDKNRWRYLQYLSTFGIFVTIHTTKQHYLIDGVAGMALAALTHWALFVWWPRLRMVRA